MVVGIRQGNYIVIKNQFPDIESQEAETLTSLAENKGDESGTLEGLHLRFPRGKIKPDQAVRYVFADIYEKQNLLYWQMIHSFVIEASSFAIFFLFSILLPGQAAKLVEIVWQRQRQFIAGASHKLKTFLTVILSDADMLEEDHDIPKGQNRQRISHIRTESPRTKQLIESFLAMARSDSGQESAICVSVDLSLIANSGFMAFEPLTFNMDKHITYDVEASLRINGDDKKLWQLIGILFNNACRYSQDNGSICITPKRASAKEALFTVSDRGASLMKEEIKHLFPRFYCGDIVRSNISGYGPGLSIAQSIVSEHGGEIEASMDGFATNSLIAWLPIREQESISGHSACLKASIYSMLPPLPRIWIPSSKLSSGEFPASKVSCITTTKVLPETPSAPSASDSLPILSAFPASGCIFRLSSQLPPTLSPSLPPYIPPRLSSPIPAPGFSFSSPSSPLGIPLESSLEGVPY